MRTRRMGSLMAVAVLLAGWVWSRQELFGKILSLMVVLLFSFYLRITIKGTTVYRWSCTSMERFPSRMLQIGNWRPVGILTCQANTESW